MEKILIMAYMGTGKTELEKQYENVVDFDFQDYKYIYDLSIRQLPLEQRKGSTHLRTENPDYPQNFLRDAIHLLNAGKIVVSPFIDHVFDAYDQFVIQENCENLRVILVAPRRDNFEEYVERFRNRGNREAFIARREKEFSGLIDLFEQVKGYEKIVIKPLQYLSEALEEYGISLEKKRTKKIK